MAIGFNLPNGAFRLNAQEAGGQPDYMAALQSGLKGSQMASETVMQPQNLSEALLQAQLKNAHDRTINKYLDEQQRSEISNRYANTGLTNQQILHRKILNSFLPESERLRLNTGNETLTSKKIGNEYLRREKEQGLQKGADAHREANIKSQIDQFKADNPFLSLSSTPGQIMGLMQWGANNPEELVKLENVAKAHHTQMNPGQELALQGSPQQSGQAMNGQVSGALMSDENPLKGIMMNGMGIQPQQQPSPGQPMEIGMEGGQQQEPQISPMHINMAGGTRPSEMNAPNSPLMHDLGRLLTASMQPKNNAYQGPAREALDLSRLKIEHPEAYAKALELSNQKSQTNAALNQQRLRRAGGLKPGETEVKNSAGEVIGISRDYSPAEKKEEKGRIYFNTSYPKILRATSYYSGQGSIERYANDVMNYKTDKKAQKRVDNYLAAIKSIGPGAVKENATIGGANTNQVYNRLISTLNSSDLPKKVDEIAKKYGLPKEAQLRAGLIFQDMLNESTDESKKIPARHIEYFGGDKKGHIYNPETKSLDSVIVSPEHWDDFTKAGGY